MKQRQANVVIIIISINRTDLTPQNTKSMPHTLKYSCNNNNNNNLH